MSTSPETPLQEAISLVSIASILAGVACYAGAVQNVPIVSPALFHVAEVVYQWFPQLSALRGAQIPMLVASAAVGVAVFVIGLSFAGPLASLFNASQIGQIEKQTIRLKRNRARIVKSRRDRDDFDVF